MRLFILNILVYILLLGCQENTKKATLRDIDIIDQNSKQTFIYIKPKTDTDIRKAYASYLKNATQDDNSRMAAINRLAELEFDLSNKLLKENESLDNDKANKDQDDKIYNKRLDKTIELLETSLKDYPKSKNNDKLYYQLAKAYDQRGNYNRSILALTKIASGYPKSPYYIESNFRIAEAAFARADYITAEDAYTEVIISQKNDIFFEKSVFKRGWSRFKQDLYLQAVDDFLEAVSYHEFSDIEKLNLSEKNQFDEYFRSIGLAFAYLGGAQPLYDYYKNNPDAKYIYHSYKTVANIFLKQERFSDAVDTHKQFINYYPKSDKIPFSHLHIIDIWKNSGFSNKLYTAIDHFYQTYNPSSAYWKNNQHLQHKDAIDKSLQNYLALVASHYHNKYQKSKKNSDFENADKWYNRYLNHYQQVANKDRVNFLYAELLAEKKQYSKALKHYNLAAYNDNEIINKDAAYASITVTDKLHRSRKDPKNVKWLNMHIGHSLRYSAKYKADKGTEQLLLNAATLAYQTKLYQRAIDVSTEINPQASLKVLYHAKLIQAQSEFDLGNHAKSELIYIDLRKNNYSRADAKRLSQLNDKLALSIYKQAVAEDKKSNIQQAMQHYLRISEVTPVSEIASTGHYDAIALAMTHNQWDSAIKHIKSFKQRYPGHKSGNDITRKLSVAYLNSNQDIKAAKEFEKISSFETDDELRKTALWQAAELYEAKKDYPSAIRSYTEYANKHTRPFPQHMESMYKLIELNKLIPNTSQVDLWRKKILNTDKNTPKKLKNDRTKYIASISIIDMARSKYEEYKNHRLVEPLKTNLRKKKKAMQSAVKLYGRASIYGISETATEATYSIAEIYKDFSQSLLDSERPKNLSTDELEQYEILIEDQAFPFEDKAIEFFETNLAHIKNGIYNDWVKKSHTRLKELFPVRYNRSAKIEPFINDIY